MNTPRMRNAKDVVMGIHAAAKKIEAVTMKCARAECLTGADISDMKAQIASLQGSILALERVYNKTPEPEVGE